MSAQLQIAGVTWEPFVRDLRRVEAPTEWFIERVPSDRRLGDRIEVWKTMAACGWDVTALVAPDSKTVVACGCRGPV